MARKFGKFGLKALFVSCAFIDRVTEALYHESMNEDFRGCSRDDKLVFIEEINKYLAQVFKTVKFAISVV